MRQDLKKRPLVARVETVTLGPGRSLHAAIAGAGRDIVLIHGAMTTHRDWRDGPFAALAGLGRVIAVDRPGHGLSERPRFSGDPRLQAAQIRDGLRALGVTGPVLLVGHSFGCVCALAYAEQYPDEVDALVLVSPLALPELRLEHGLVAPRATPVLGPLWAGLTPAFVERTMLEAMHPVMFWPASPSATWKRNYPWAQILDRSAIVANAEDSASVHPLSLEARLDLAAIRMPVRIISGTADRVVMEGRQAAPLDAALPHSEHIRIAGAGHMLHHSHGKAVIEAVREALGETVARPAAAAAAAAAASARRPRPQRRAAAPS